MLKSSIIIVLLMLILTLVTKILKEPFYNLVSCESVATSEASVHALSRLKLSPWLPRDVMGSDNSTYKGSPWACSEIHHPAPTFSYQKDRKTPYGFEGPACACPDGELQVVKQVSTHPTQDAHTPVEERGPGWRWWKCIKCYDPIKTTTDATPRHAVAETLTEKKTDQGKARVSKDEKANQPDILAPDFIAAKRTHSSAKKASTPAPYAAHLAAYEQIVRSIKDSTAAIANAGWLGGGG